MKTITNINGKLVLEEIDVNKENLKLITESINKIEEKLGIEKTKFLKEDD